MENFQPKLKNLCLYGLGSLATTLLIANTPWLINRVEATGTTAAFFAGFDPNLSYGLSHRIDSEDRDVVVEAPLNPGEVLYVRARTRAWAALGFLVDGNYSGPILKTIPSDTGAEYRFPCGTSSDFMIAWRPADDGGERACGEGVEAISSRYSNPLTSKNTKFLSSTLASFWNKQLSDDEQLSDDVLNIQPGDEQVVLRKMSVSGGSEWRCEREESSDGTSWSESCWTVPLQNTVVDVLLGDVSVQSDESPSGQTVRQGERFTYPGGEITPIDATGEANTCEVQKFLNPYYWTVPPSIPDSVLDEMKAQLAEHREAIGIFGGNANLSTLEQGVIDEMNYARTDPAAYAQLLQERRQYYRGNRLELPGKVPIVGLNEGVAAVDDAIHDLQAISRPLEPLGASDGLSRAAQDLVNEQSRSGAVGHGDWQSRIDRYGESGCIPRTTENVSYGYDTARNVVMQLIIDDGSPNRGHREAILNPDLQVTGVACGSHPQYRSMCTITYAGGYKERL